MSEKIAFSSEQQTFVSDIRVLLTACEKANGKENRLKICIEIYKLINKKFPELIEKYHYYKKSYIKFAITAYNKAIEFELEYQNKLWDDYVCPDLIKQFMDILYLSLDILSEYLIDYNKNNIDNNEQLIKTLDIIKKRKLEQAKLSGRPKRNIKKVSYVGMDTIEPKSEYDAITNIWFDKTIYYDSDYEFEEDYDDDDEQPISNKKERAINSIQSILKNAPPLKTSNDNRITDK